jgi:hypothetical protein
MTPTENRDPATLEKALRAKMRMAYFLLLLFVIHIVEAAVTYPFVDHTSTGQNVVYGFIVAAPFYTVSILFLIITRRDFAATRE